MTRFQEEVSDEMLMALADGELDAATAARLMTRVQADPALAARYGMFAETRALLAEAWETAGPVPDRLIAAVMMAEAAPQAQPAATATVVPFRRKVMAAPAAMMALAASVVLAVGVAGFFAGRGSAPQSFAAGPQAAAVALARVPTGGEAALPDGTTARALASYDTETGLCRLIAVAQDRAVVCQGEGAGWHVALSVAGPGAGGFLPASDIGTELVESVLDALAASAPLDPAAEAAALNR